MFLSCLSWPSSSHELLRVVMMWTHVLNNSVESEQNSLNSLFPEFVNCDQSMRKLKQFSFFKSNLGYDSHPPGETADDTNLLNCI